MASQLSSVAHSHLRHPKHVSLYCVNTEYTKRPFLLLAFTLEIPQVSPVEAGFQQSLICLIMVNSSLTPPSITWISPDGQEIKDNSSTLTVLPLTVPMDDITNVQVTLLFPVVMTSYAGLYTCRAVTEDGEMATVAEYLIVKSMSS